MALTEAKTQDEDEDGEKGWAGIESATLTLLCWLVLLGLGGGLLSLYYAGIGYFPEVSWRDSLTYIAVLTILGGSLVVSYGFLLLVPGVFWSKLLIHEEQLKKDLCFNCPVEGDEPCTWTVATRIGGPFAIFMAITHLLVQYGQPIFVGGSILALGAASILCAFLLRRDFRIHDLKVDGEPRSLFGKAALSFSASGLVSLVALIAIYRIADPEAKNLASILLICTVTAVVANLFVAVQFKKHKALAAAGSLLAAMFLLVSGDIFAGSASASVPQRIMALYGIGGEETTYTLLLTAEGSEHLQQLGAPVAVQPSFKAGSISRAQILSRLGDDLAFRADGRMYVIPERFVVGFATDQMPGDRR